ncbi:MAG: response regulator [Pirellulaceae bacterium]
MQPWSNLPLRNRRILLVEDCPDDQRLMARILTRAGSDVMLECSGESAIYRIRHVAANERCFDLVVMDLQMPGMDGIETTRKLRATGCQTPIVAVTARGDEATERVWKDAGCISYLTKPFPPDALISVACQAMTNAEV